MDYRKTLFIFPYPRPVAESDAEDEIVVELNKKYDNMKDKLILQVLVHVLRGSLFSSFGCGEKVSRQPDNSKSLVYYFKILVTL